MFNPAAAANNELIQAIETNNIYERFTLRTKVKFAHGENKARNPKFGGIYNLIKSAKIRYNNDADHFKVSATDLYVDTFTRSGRENNDVNYQNLPNELTHNIEYCFSGRQSILNGVTVPNAAFGLDLRHSQERGNQTFNSLNLHLEVGTIHDVFNDVNDTAIESITFEIWGEQLIHTQQSAEFYGVATTLYAETINKHDMKEKIADVTQPCEFTLEPVGERNQNVNLSDFTIVQLDQNSVAVPFDDDNAKLVIMVGEHEYCSTPIWRLRKSQNAARLQPMPPNVLHVTLRLSGTEFGGLGTRELFGNARIFVKANEVQGQVGETQLRLLKTYTFK